jgi:uncharacterized protein YceK
MKIIGMALPMLILMLNSGCATILVRSSQIQDRLWSPLQVSDGGSDRIYPATQIDAVVMYEAGVLGKDLIGGRPTPAGELIIYVTLSLLDLPFSVVFDTILLPLDLIGWVVEPSPTVEPPTSGGGP